MAPSPVSSELAQFLAGIWPPVAIAAPLLLATWRPWSRRRPETGAAAGASLAIGLGFAGAFVALKGLPSVPPVRGDEWLMIAGLASATLGSIGRLSDRAWYPLAALIALAMPFAVLARPIERKWDLGETLVEAGGAGLLTVAIALGLAALAQRSRGPALSLSCATVAAAAGAVLMAGYSASLGQLSGALATLAAIAAGVGCWHRGFTIGRGGALTFAVLFSGLLLNGQQFAGAEPTRVLVVGLAPLGAWVGHFVPGGRWARGLAALATVALVVAWPTWASIEEILESPY